MTGADFQDKLDATVSDLQTAGKGQTVQITLRNNSNELETFPLSSTAQGVVDAAQLATIQSVVDAMKVLADDYAGELVPVSAASETFSTARSAHQVLIDAASAARQTLADALEADQEYQTAKLALDAARADAGYVAAREVYRVNNVGENFGNLGDAKGKYIL